ncbi:MAG: hypothetical protein ACYCW6_22865 [Candidatus Xenobia bacterium]
MTPDAGLEEVRRVREKISRQFDNDPEKLVKHYIELQEQYQERLRRGPEEVQAAGGTAG